MSRKPDAAGNTSTACSFRQSTASTSNSDNSLLTATLSPTRFDKVTKDLHEKKSMELAQEDSNVTNSCVSVLTQQINDSLSPNNDYLKLTKELGTKKKNEKYVKKTTDEEILYRVTAENKLQSLKENFEFKEEVYKQPPNDTRISLRTEDISEIDRRLLKEYEDKLQSELQLLRQQADNDVKQSKKEITELFNNEVQKLENELQCKQKAMELAQEDLNATNSRVCVLKQRIDDLLSLNNDYLLKITELEGQKENQRTKYLAEIHGIDQQLTVIQDSMSQGVQEYKDLLDIKVALDMAISAHRKLLESEERRLSITPNTSAVSSPRGTKRKFFQGYKTEYEFSNVITSLSTGSIEISEVCPNGKFVKLHNRGSKEIALSGHELIRTTAGQNLSTVFKFHHTVKLRAGYWLTIWSSTASNQIHELSSESIIMNAQAWVSGDLMATKLLNSEGQEIAFHEFEKRQVPHSESNKDYVDYKSVIFHDEPSDPQTDDKCIIM